MKISFSTQGIFISILFLIGNCNHIYTVKDMETNKLCLGIEFGAAITIPYKTISGNTNTYELRIGKVDHQEGTCGQNEILLSVDFHEIRNPTSIWNFKMVFLKSDKTFKLSRFELKGTLDIFAVIDIKDEINIDQSVIVNAFETENNFMAYCEYPTVVFANNVFSFRMYEVQIVSFVQENRIYFNRQFKQCESDLSNAVYVAQENELYGYCLVMKGNFSFEIEYKTNEDKLKKYTMNLPGKHFKRYLRGDCSKKYIASFVKFRPIDHMDVDEFEADFKFVLDEGEYTLESVTIFGNLDQKFIPDLKSGAYFSDKFFVRNTYKTKPGNVFICQTPMNFTSGKNTVLHIENFVVKAFEEIRDINFNGKKEICSVDQNNNSTTQPALWQALFYALLA